MSCAIVEEAGTERPEETHFIFLRRASWVAVEATCLSRMCGMCQDLQQTCRRDLDVRGKPRDTGVARDRASVGLNQSRISLWIVTAVVCVAPRISLLWYVLISYSLITLRYFMYLSISLHLELVHTSIPKTKAGSWWEVLNLWEICLQAFGHSSSLLIFQKALKWLWCCCCLAEGASSCSWSTSCRMLCWGRWAGLSWSTDTSEKLCLSGPSTEISCSLLFLKVFLSFMWLLIQTMLAFMGALMSLLWKFASSLFNSSIKTKQNSLWIHPSLQNKAWQSLVPQISHTGLLSCA